MLSINTSGFYIYYFNNLFNNLTYKDCMMILSLFYMYESVGEERLSNQDLLHIRLDPPSA